MNVNELRLVSQAAVEINNLIENVTDEEIFKKLCEIWIMLDNALTCTKLNLKPIEEKS